MLKQNLRLHLRIELGTPRTEGSALTNCASRFYLTLLKSRIVWFLALKKTLFNLSFNFAALFNLLAWKMQEREAYCTSYAAIPFLHNLRYYGIYAIYPLQITAFVGNFYVSKGQNKHFQRHRPMTRSSEQRSGWIMFVCLIIGRKCFTYLRTTISWVSIVAWPAVDSLKKRS